MFLHLLIACSKGLLGFFLSYMDVIALLLTVLIYYFIFGVQLSHVIFLPWETALLLFILDLAGKHNTPGIRLTQCSGFDICAFEQ